MSRHGCNRPGPADWIGVDVIEFKSVPSYPRFVATSEGGIIGPSGRELRRFVGSRGYQRVTIYLGDRRWRQVSVHVLVCEAFHGPRPAWASLVAHGDGDPLNNRPENLRWATTRENHADKMRHGTELLGERCHFAVLSEGQVREIRSRRGAGESGVNLAKEFGVTPSAISAVHRGKTWRHVR